MHDPAPAEYPTDDEVRARMRQRSLDPAVQDRLVEIIDRPPIHRPNNAPADPESTPSSRRRNRGAIPEPPDPYAAEQRAARVDHAAVRYWVDHPDAELPDDTDDRAVALAAAGYFDEAAT